MSLMPARRALALALLCASGAVVLLGLTPSVAGAHPLGNFTTNTAVQLSVRPDDLGVLYVVDLAEIPTLKVRQELGPVTGPVPSEVGNPWRDAQCATLGRGLAVRRGGNALTLAPERATLSFKAGQAGLTTLRLECRFATAPSQSGAELVVTDGNFADRLGWREISAVGDGMRLSGVATASPTRLLRSYATGAASSPLRQTTAGFTAAVGGAAGTEGTGAARPSGPAGDVSRGNDGLTERFQSLVARRDITLPFALGSIALAVVLGGFHAMAPGHGKTIMAAYAVSRRGSRGDIVSIGATVALTHTIGIIVLGALVSATSVVSPDRTLRWASVGSGVLVVAVGVTLVRSRFRSTRRPGRIAAGVVPEHPHSHDHDHDQHEHEHEHPHPHPHPHDHDQHEHEHDHDHHPHEAGAHTRAHPSDGRFIVTSHAHGGWQHDHVLPAPGALVRRRELIAMGLAGGMVPSPSALVVLLAAIALGRVPFGLGLVAAYGIGLAGTLIAAGLLLVRFETVVRRFTTGRDTPMGARMVMVVNALPLVSGLAIVGAGLLLVVRSVAKL